MARLSRIVVSGYPHHITQRGNRRQKTFSQPHTSCSSSRTEDGMRKAIGEVHRRYARMINFREGWRGYLWQGRFHSFVMDERYLPAAVRYIELNPVMARLVTDPISYPWSNARAHIEKRDDALVRVSPLSELIPD